MACSETRHRGLHVTLVKRTLRRTSLLVLAAGVATSGVTQTAPKSAIIIDEQGSFAVGGSVVSSPGSFDPRHPTAAGQTLHGDHAYVFYQIPANRRKLPLVFLHGTGQFSKTWETTPDGREGFQNIFLRRRFSVYLLDQPRRGDAGRATVSSTVTETPDEQGWFDTFRVGTWPDYFPGVQFSKDPEVLDQYFRQMTPNVAPYDPTINADVACPIFCAVR